MIKIPPFNGVFALSQNRSTLSDGIQLLDGVRWSCLLGRFGGSARKLKSGEERLKSGSSTSVDRANGGFPKLISRKQW
jgi:hypothetical protein